MTTRSAALMFVTIVAVAACGLGLVACGPQSGNTASKSSPGASHFDLSAKVALAADPNVTVRSYLGPHASLADTLTRDTFKRVSLTPFAFWRVETDTTPSVDAISAVLLSMAARYGGHGRSIDLRVDWGGRTTRGDPAWESAFFWNPTGSQSTGWGYGMNPGPHSIEVWTGEGGMFSRNAVRVTASQVTTQGLVDASGGGGTVFEQLGKGTPLR